MKFESSTQNNKRLRQTQTLRVIILIPIYNSARYWAQVSSRLRRLDPQPDLYIFAENNSTDETLQLISSFDRSKEILRFWFRDNALDFCETRFDLIGIVRQFLLQRARQLNPDFAIFLDSDILVESTDLITLLTRIVLPAEIGPDMCLVGGPYPGFSHTLSVRLDALSYGWKGGNISWQEGNARRPITTLEEIVATGGGCMCLPRRLIQDRRVNFYPVETSEYESEELKQDLAKQGLPNMGEDYTYCYRARALGYHVVMNWDVYLDHLYDDYKSRTWSMLYGESQFRPSWRYGVGQLDKSRPIVELGRLVDGAKTDNFMKLIDAHVN